MRCELTSIEPHLPPLFKETIMGINIPGIDPGAVATTAAVEMGGSMLNKIASTTGNTDLRRAMADHTKVSEGSRYLPRPGSDSSPGSGAASRGERIPNSHQVPRRSAQEDAPKYGSSIPKSSGPAANTGRGRAESRSERKDMSNPTAVKAKLQGEIKNLENQIASGKLSSQEKAAAKDKLTHLKKDLNHVNKVIQDNKSKVESGGPLW